MEALILRLFNKIYEFRKEFIFGDKVIFSSNASIELGNSNTTNL